MAVACKELDIHPLQVVAIGDAQNDVEMFRVAGTSFAMGQASDMVKAAATRVTAPNDEDGVAQAIRTVLAARRRLSSAAAEATSSAGTIRGSWAVPVHSSRSASTALLEDVGGLRRPWYPARTGSDGPIMATAGAGRSSWLPLGRMAPRPAKYIGTTGTSLARARIDTPWRNLPSLPLPDRVPSGKMATEKPLSISHFG